MARPKTVYYWRKQRRQERERRCVYCGMWCTGRTCREHRVLQALDPYYSTARRG